LSVSRGFKQASWLAGQPGLVWHSPLSGKPEFPWFSAIELEGCSLLLSSCTRKYGSGSDRFPLCGRPGRHFRVGLPVWWCNSRVLLIVPFVIPTCPAVVVFFEPMSQQCYNLWPIGCINLLHNAF
jgi:hypothetical protein